MAERYRRQTIIDLDRCQFQNSYDIHPADDPVWANRMVWIYAHVVNLCFRPESERDQTSWDSQNEQLDIWKNSLPQSFSPLYYKPTSSHSKFAFPAEWFLSEWHGRSDWTPFHRVFSSL